MARMTSSRSRLVEDTEGDLAQLGNSLVYLRLVTERIQAVMAVLPQQTLLSPAVDDLHQASRLIRNVQQRASERLGMSPAASEYSEFSSKKNHKVHQTAPCGRDYQKKGRRS